MRKSFTGNILLLLIINLLIKPIYLFGIDAQVQNTVGPEVYGVYFALFNFCFLFQFFLDPGLQNYNSTQVAANRENTNEIFKTTFALKLLLASCFAILVLLGAYIIFPALYLSLLIKLIIIQILISSFLYFRSHFSALGEYRKDVLFSVLDKVLLILLIGYFLLTSTIDIDRFVNLQIIAFSIANLIAILFLSRKIQIRLHFDLRQMKAILTKAAPFAMVLLLMTLYSKMDGVMLERLLKDDGYQAGVYAAGYRLFDAVNMIGFLFASLLLPMFARKLSQKETIDVLVNHASKLVMIIICLVTVSSYFYGHDVLKLIYTDYQDHYLPVFRYLMMGFAPIALSYIFGTIFLASAKLKKLNFIFLIGIIINWAGNLWAIPRYGATGAAAISLVTQSFVTLAQLVLAHLLFDIRLQPKNLMNFALILVIGILFNIYIVPLLNLAWFINLILSLIVMLVFSILSGFLRLNTIFGTAFE